MKRRAVCLKLSLILAVSSVVLMSCATAGTGDDNDATSPEVGIEWVTDYSWPHSDLPNSDDSAKAFYNGLGSAGWTRKFDKGNTNTKEEHFQHDGQDSTYIDGVDIAWYQGHAQNNRLELSTYTKWVSFFNEIEWGDHDLEWIALHGCHSTEKPDRFKGSHYGLNGVHLICGFTTSSLNCVDGGNFADNLLDGETVKDAWYHAIDETHGSDYTVRIIGENSACGNDHIWGEGSVIADPTVNSGYTTWTYSCS
ncbi:MAG: hypothetical protein JW878_03595 [Methanomicrobia archaeon]|nr:hypothetical protein [Methanomicrobia archaeon]